MDPEELKAIILQAIKEVRAESRAANEHNENKFGPKSRPGEKWMTSIFDYKRRQNMKVFRPSVYQIAIKKLLEEAKLTTQYGGLCMNELLFMLPQEFKKMDINKRVKRKSIESALSKLRDERIIRAEFRTIRYKYGDAEVLVYRMRF